MASTESGWVNRPAAPSHALAVEKMYGTRASTAGESEISSGVSGQDLHDVVVAVGSRGFQVFMSESAAKKLEIYVSQVKTIGCYQNKES